MDNKKYKKEALRTNTPNRVGVSKRLNGEMPKISGGYSSKFQDLIHASMGLSTEAAEFTDALKKHIFYGKELDEVNLKEEIGDILWYAAIALEALDSNFEEVMQTNIDKLSARYPDKFTEELAENRNLGLERAILEDGKK